MQTLSEFAEKWENSEAFTKHVKESFDELVNATPRLKEHRDFVEQHAFGFGERCFLWMWKLIVDTFEGKPFNFLEIGVYKGQILSLIRMLSDTAKIYGVTPLDTSGGMPEENYRLLIETIHNILDIRKDYRLFEGRSDNMDVLNKVSTEVCDIDVLYIDGGHSRAEARHDILTYGRLVPVGGYMVIDDCACRIKHPMDSGYFMGIHPVCSAVDEILPPYGNSDEWIHIGSIIHNRIWQRVAKP